MSDSISYNQEIFLWPGTAPGSDGLVIEPKEPISGITKPSITAILPENPNGASIIIAGGGSYEKVVFGKEGVKIAEWFNEMGITGFVLKYRLPNEGHLDGHNVPLQDAQRAIRLIRKNSRNWGLDPERIGFIGFSSGGHLTATIGTNYNKVVYPHIDDIDDLSARPDFLIMAYPVIARTNINSESSIYQTPKHRMYNEYITYEQVTAETPKSFIVCGHDDAKVNPRSTVKFYQAALDAGAESELHIFHHARHGFALVDSDLDGNPIGLWPDLCKQWLTYTGILPKNEPQELLKSQV